MTRVADYLDQIRASLRLKDPRRLTKAQQGAIVLLLSDDDGLHRATVLLEPGVARLCEGVVDADQAQSLTVRASLPTWIAFFERGVAAYLNDIDFFGDIVLLRTWAELASQSVSPLALRVQRDRNGG